LRAVKVGRKAKKKKFGRGGGQGKGVMFCSFIKEG